MPLAIQRYRGVNGWRFEKFEAWGRYLLDSPYLSIHILPFFGLLWLLVANLCGLDFAKTSCREFSERTDARSSRIAGWMSFHSMLFTVFSQVRDVKVSKCKHHQNQIIAAKSCGFNVKLRVLGSMCTYCEKSSEGGHLLGCIFWGLQAEEKSQNSSTQGALAGALCMEWMGEGQKETETNDLLERRPAWLLECLNNCEKRDLGYLR